MEGLNEWLSSREGVGFESNPDTTEAGVEHKN